MVVMAEKVGAFLLGALVTQCCITFAVRNDPAWYGPYRLRCFALLACLAADFFLWRAVK